MEKIPTVDEIIERHFGDKLGLFTRNDVAFIALETAKLHVEAAIKTCIEEAPSGSSTDTVSYEDVVESLKDCYPLDKIK